jgi:hypothetical protein
MIWSPFFNSLPVMPGSSTITSGIFSDTRASYDFPSDDRKNGAQ